MSSSSSSPKGKDNEDVTMDTPDSPPEFNQTSGGWQPSAETKPAQANTGSRVNGDTKVHFGAPGSCWQTKKFNEEYERAESSLLDKAWTGSTQYGDVLRDR